MTSATAAFDRARLPAGVEIKGDVKPGYERILTPEALAFVADLARKFEATRRSLMTIRDERQATLDAGALPDFLAETKAIRDSDWTIRAVPGDLLASFQHERAQHERARERPT